MTSRQRVLAALEGLPVDRMPVATSYVQLYQLDHYGELTGRPQWENEAWRHMPVEEHLAIYRTILDAAPFDILQPQIAPTRADREAVRFEVRNGHPVRIDARTGDITPLDTVSGHARDYAANETQRVFDLADVRAQVTIASAEARVASGRLDYVQAARAAMPDAFILTGGVIGTFYSSHGYLGLTNLLEMAADQPDLVDELSRRILEANIEEIRALARAGGDAIYIDDACTTCDMISPALFERFSVPYMTAMVDEIHRLDHKAIIIYFGGVADRLEQIAAMGADAVTIEASMKGYTNDIADAVRRIGDRTTLYANIDPVGVLQDGTDAALEAEIARQVAAGRAGRGFIISTASPITPGTPVARVRRFIELGRHYARTAA
jgi:uroporphyrinogen-III decarboxylase